MYAQEKIIGVVGLAPVATADFYKKLIQLTPAKKDWEHVRVIIDSNPKIPSRGRYFDLHEENPVPYIRQSIEMLLNNGADIIAIPCNTAHILYDDYAIGWRARVVNLVEVTVDALLSFLPFKPQSVAVLGSRLTNQHKLYANLLKIKGCCSLDVSIYQPIISELIEAVKQGVLLESLQKQWKTLMLSLKGADAIIIGCTELSLFLNSVKNNIPIIDSNLALASACLRLANGKVREDKKCLTL